MLWKVFRFSPLSIMLFQIPLLLTLPKHGFAEFKVLKPGFESRELKLQTGLFTSELVVVRINTKLWRIKVFKGPESKTAQEVCQETNSAAAINANFFGTNLQPLGLIISNSTLLHPLQLGGHTLTGIYVNNPEMNKIIHRDKFQSSDDFVEAVQAGPRLIADGQPISIPEDSSTRRSAIAIDGNGRILLFASKDRFPGLSLKEFQQILLDKDLDIKDALNLDGGGSSQLYVSYSKLGQEISVSGGDRVPVFLTVKEVK